MKRLIIGLVLAACAICAQTVHAQLELNTTDVWEVDYQTQTAATVIIALVPPKDDNHLTRVTSLSVRNGTTANNWTLMRPIAHTTTAAAAAAAQKVIALTNFSPGKTTSTGAVEALAAADYLAWENPDGTVSFDIVASVSSPNVTMTANLPKAIVAGAKVWAFYEVGRANHAVLGVAASATRDYVSPSGLFAPGIIAPDDPTNVRSGFGDPLIIYCPNATAACFLEHASGDYVR